MGFIKSGLIVACILTYATSHSSLMSRHREVGKKVAIAASGRSFDLNERTKKMTSGFSMF